MPVHVSLHDVSPHHQDAIEAIVADAARFHIRPALLVVPNFHGRFPLGDHPVFVSRLRDLQAAGHEVYLHGYYHLTGCARATNTGGSPTNLGLGWFWDQRIVSHGEAEFSDLSRPEALRRIRQGIKELEAQGLRVDGFVPPAWSMPRWLLPILADNGVAFTEDHLGVIDPASGQRNATLLLNFATRSKVRMAATVLYCQAVSPLANLIPARLAIHPSDYGFALLRRQIQGLFARLSGQSVAKGTQLFGEASAQDPGRALPEPRARDVSSS